MLWPRAEDGAKVADVAKTALQSVEGRTTGCGGAVRGEQ